MKFATALTLAIGWVVGCLWIGAALFEYVVPEGHWTRTPLFMTMACIAVAGYAFIGARGIPAAR